MPAIISIVGTSNSGKTTLIERLLRELKYRGYRVATVKNSPHGTSLDQPGKDSWRHIEAGSEATILISKDRMFLIKPVTPEMGLEEMTRLLGEDHDIIISEGHKQDEGPKIEVHRKEVGPPLRDIKNLVAIATDEPLETKARQFSLEDIKSLADFIEQDFIKPQENRLSLYINNEPVSLSIFPRDIVTNILVGIASSLRGVGKVNSLKLFLRKRD